MRATTKQKKYILYINRGLGIPVERSMEIVSDITFRDADSYIKRFLPQAKFKSLNDEDIKEVYRYMMGKTQESLPGSRRGSNKKKRESQKEEGTI